jgi:long-subunit acyl-CoA synthetase (AMP-forming)
MMTSQIVDVNTGLVLGRNQTGEIWLRSTANMKGYLGNDQATRDTIDSQGWLHTGILLYPYIFIFMYLFCHLSEGWG